MIVRAILLALGLTAGASAVSAQTQQVVNPENIRAAATQALRTNDPVAAAQFANLLLQRDPNDTGALLLRAEAAILMREFASATGFASRAYYSTDNTNAKYTAARLTALSHAEQQQDTRAQLWLRSARQYAPNAQEAASVANDYRFLRDRNPWSTSLRFGITPSSNVNNGSQNETARLFDLPIDFQLSGDARALSGIEISAGVSTQYRLNATETSATFLNLDVDGRTYVLSADAREQAPNADGSDYADYSVTLGATHRWVAAPGAQPTSITGKFGQNWYGGEKYSQFFDVSGSQSWILSDQDLLNVELSAQRRIGFTTQNTDPVNSGAVFVNWTHLFGTGDRLQLGAGYRKSVSETVDSDYVSTRLVANYSFAQDFAGAGFSFGVDYDMRDYEMTRYQRGGREDTTLTGRARIVLTDVEYYGFQPVVTLEATRSTSNVDLFDREYFRFGFDLQSSF